MDEHDLRELQRLKDAWEAAPSVETATAYIDVLEQRLWEAINAAAPEAWQAGLLGRLSGEGE